MSKKTFTNDFTINDASRYYDLPIPIGEVSATDTKKIFITPNIVQDGVEYEFVSFSLVTETGITAHDTNYWSIMISNLTDTLDLLADPVTTKVTGGTAITADTPWIITPDQNKTTGANKVIKITFTKAASVSTMEEVSVLVHYRVKGRFE